MQDIQSLIFTDDKDFYSTSNIKKLEAQLTQITKQENHKINSEENRKWAKEYLRKTRKPQYLTKLTPEERLQWTEHCFFIIREINFGIIDLIEQRTKEHPNKVLFQDIDTHSHIRWTYKQIYNKITETAAFIKRIEPKKPRVILYLENSVNGAVIDLACLAYGIYNTPLNTHLNSDTLSHIFKKTEANILFTDNLARLQTAKKAAKKANLNITFIATNAQLHNHNQTEYFLEKALKEKNITESIEYLKQFPKRNVSQVATSMFTSGSTGIPKGVSFSEYNIISKRYARAAALPEVGNNEVFICYLPLFHTFGRYLEMTGSIFWGGTYVFAGNPSAATLLSLFPKINPTGFISVPIRWLQIYQKCINALDQEMTPEEVKSTIQKIVGTRLKWGLSAAGYLAPEVFKFFIKNGINLNSGFGMTEATGGITMTPPGEYVENSTGIPLPGMQTRLTAQGELELKSHYLGRYFDENSTPNHRIPYPHEEDFWLPTGDIFRVHKNGHHEIIDRIKDIYKNNKGQTVSPGNIEKKFINVPAITTTFLVGDGRANNVLLIVPNRQDPIFNSFETESNVREYYRQIIMTANQELVPYERIVNFKLLDRNFSTDKGELTPKGNFNRKQILQNFSSTIEELYKSNKIEFKFENFKVTIPRWLFRDLGILETDIIQTPNGIKDKISKLILEIAPTDKPNKFKIGDLIYKVTNNDIDLGRMIRQPFLWMGNPQLTAFFPCKDSYELPFKQFKEQVCVTNADIKYQSNEKALQNISNSELSLLNELLCTAMFAEKQQALKSLLQIGKIFHSFDKYKASIVKRRLEALACHNCDELRMNAYRILLLNDNDEDYAQIFPSFIKSGKKFLNMEMIEKIANEDFGKKQLESFRKRMHAYRQSFSKKQSKQTEQQFETIFNLLKYFSYKEPTYYGTIRAELSNWILMKSEPYMSAIADATLTELYDNFTEFVMKENPIIPQSEWENKIIFDNDFEAGEKERIIKILSQKQFLLQSIIVIYDEPKVKLSDIEDKRIWISRNNLYSKSQQYRVAINTKTGKHFDILIIMNENINSPNNTTKILQHIALASYPYGLPLMAKFGCSNPASNVYSVQYTSQPTCWEHITNLSNIPFTSKKPQKNAWRNLFINSISALYKANNNCIGGITPEKFSPNNVIITKNDFSYTSKIISTKKPKFEIPPIEIYTQTYHNFYLKTMAHYPKIAYNLNPDWIFQALYEAFGREKAKEKLLDLITSISSEKELSETSLTILNLAKKHIEIYESKVYFPLAMYNAINRYTDWNKKNPHASTKAKKQTVTELIELYKLHKYPEVIRFKFYSETYFHDISEQVTEKFNKLLLQMDENPTSRSIQFTELSELQEALTEQSDRNVFTKMVFPDINEQSNINFRKALAGNAEKLIIQSQIKDKKNQTYIMQKACNPQEVGTLYKLFFKENYPKQISPMDKHYITTDAYKRVIGGLCYRYIDKQIVLLDGIVVKSSLQHKGIASAMIENFFTLMKAENIKTIKAHFLFGNYYLKHQFVVDKNWGALIKNLDD